MVHKAHDFSNSSIIFDLHLILGAKVYILSMMLYLSSCQDFSRFDCFGQSSGCQPPSQEQYYDPLMVDMMSFNTAPQDMMPQDMTLQDMMPQDMMPQDMMFQDMMLQDMMLQDMMPQDMMLQDMNLLDCSMPDLCDQEGNYCDGREDVGFTPRLESVFFEDLNRSNRGCKKNKLGSEKCQVSSHNVCRSRECPNTPQIGVGPVFYTVDNDGEFSNILLLCVPLESVQIVSLTYVELPDTHQCNNEGDLKNIDCRFAFQSFCNTNHPGTVAAGPLSYDNTHVEFACISGTQEFSVNFSVLAAYNSQCDYNQSQYGPECSLAIHQYCQMNNYLTGWGPIAQVEQTMTFTCISSGL